MTRMILSCCLNRPLKIVTLRVVLKEIGTDLALREKTIKEQDLPVGNPTMA